MFHLRSLGFVLIPRATVFPDGPAKIAGQELSGPYYEKAAPLVEMLVAKAGYRMAAWLDRIVEAYQAKNPNWAQEARPARELDVFDGAQFDYEYEEQEVFSGEL
jgi:hypothetical protein